MKGQCKDCGVPLVDPGSRQCRACYRSGKRGGAFHCLIRLRERATVLARDIDQAMKSSYGHEMKLSRAHHHVMSAESALIDSLTDLDARKVARS